MNALDSSLLSTQRLVWTALLAALMGVGAHVHVPLGPVPFSMQTFFVLLAGFVLGPARGALAAGLYLAAGLIGLPVFAGGTSGLGRLLGPTGGFLLSYPLHAAVAGLASNGEASNGEASDDETPPSWRRGIAWGALALAVTFACGVPWLKITLEMSWGKAATVGMLPFLPGAVVKLFLAVAAWRFLATRRLLPP